MKRVVIEDLMVHTGLGPQVARRMVREGNLPGFISGTQYVCSPGEFEKWLQGDWKPTGVRSTPPQSKKKPTLIHEIKKGRAA